MPRPGRVILSILLIFFLPLGLHAAWWLSTDRPGSWSQANWASAGLLPPASAKPEAMVHVYAARVGRWRGIFAHHTWIVVKERGAGALHRYDKVGWGTPVRTDNWAPDARWFGQVPDLIAAIEGEAAEAMIPRVGPPWRAIPIKATATTRRGRARTPTPFVAHVLAAIPEAGIALPPRRSARTRGRRPASSGFTPSSTGVQLRRPGGRRSRRLDRGRGGQPARPRRRFRRAPPRHQAPRLRPYRACRFSRSSARPPRATPETARAR